MCSNPERVPRSVSVSIEADGDVGYLHCVIKVHSYRPESSLEGYSAAHGTLQRNVDALKPAVFGFGHELSFVGQIDHHARHD